MRTPLLIAFVLLNLVAFGQNMSKKIKSVNTLDQANAFIKDNPTLGAEIIRMNTGLDTSELAKQIFADSSRKPFTYEGNTYKVVETQKTFLLRVSYIYLDGSKLSIHQIDSLRAIIIAQYKSGTSFPELAKQYNMDGNVGGDFGWVQEEYLVTDFVAAVKKHDVGEIFPIDIPAKKWYYVTLKTFEEREVYTYSVLKIKNK